MPSLLFEGTKRWNSPYINHFISADTIIPEQSQGVQAWNRYTYVNNNPIRNIDPTGHMLVEGAGEGGPCPDIACIEDNLERLSKHKKNKQQGGNLLTDNFEQGKSLGAWDAVVLTPGDFEELLEEIINDVRQETPTRLVFQSLNYDTPFYDHGTYFGIGKLSGTGCIYGKCYSRSELNYIGEGALWAAAGVSKGEGHQIVSIWKALIPINHLPMRTTPGTLEMFDIGYDAYHNAYPSPPSNTSIISVPQPMWP